MLQGLEHIVEHGQSRLDIAGLAANGGGHCLVAIGRLQIAAMPLAAVVGGQTGHATTFTTRHNADGLITFADERVSGAFAVDGHTSVICSYHTRCHR
jgi:hypothetical protein